MAVWLGGGDRLLVGAAGVPFAAAILAPLVLAIVVSVSEELLAR